MDDPDLRPAHHDPDETDPLIRVGIVADDPLSRAGLAALLVEGGLEVVPIGRAEVVVWDSDVSGPPPEGSEPLLAIAANADRTADLIAAGAGAVLSRRAGPARMSAAVIALAAGLGVLPLERLRELVAPIAPTASELPLDPLTPREREVLELLADGLTNGAIAERLDLGLSTVKFHLAALLSKFVAGTRTELVVRAIRSGELLV